MCYVTADSGSSGRHDGLEAEATPSCSFGIDCRDQHTVVCDNRAYILLSLSAGLSDERTLTPCMHLSSHPHFTWRFLSLGDRCGVFRLYSI